MLEVNLGNYAVIMGMFRRQGFVRNAAGLTWQNVERSDTEYVATSRGKRDDWSVELVQEGGVSPTLLRVGAKHPPPEVQ